MSKKVITLLTEEHSPGKQTVEILFEKMKQTHSKETIEFDLKVLNDENRLEKIYSEVVLADYFLIKDADYIRRRAFHETAFDFIKIGAFSSRDTKKLENQVDELLNLNPLQVRHLNLKEWTHLEYVEAG